MPILPNEKPSLKEDKTISRLKAGILSLFAATAVTFNFSNPPEVYAAENIQPTPISLEMESETVNTQNFVQMLQKSISSGSKNVVKPTKEKMENVLIELKIAFIRENGGYISNEDFAKGLLEGNIKLSKDVAQVYTKTLRKKYGNTLSREFYDPHAKSFENKFGEIPLDEKVKPTEKISETKDKDPNKLGIFGGILGGLAVAIGSANVLSKRNSTPGKNFLREKNIDSFDSFAKPKTGKSGDQKLDLDNFYSNYNDFLSIKNDAENFLKSYSKLQTNDNFFEEFYSRYNTLYGMDKVKTRSKNYAWLKNSYSFETVKEEIEKTYKIAKEIAEIKEPTKQDVEDYTKKLNLSKFIFNTHSNVIESILANAEIESKKN
jgi:hypothetical protein